MSARLRSKYLITAISCIILSYISVDAMSAVMPDYVRLQPVSERLDSPTAVAVDADELIYVTESSNNRLNVYSHNGNFINRLYGLHKPLSVAVDSSSSRIYIGNADTGNVEVYSSGLVLQGKLGSGDGEFQQPGAIAIDSSGRIYVADSKADEIKVYNADRTAAFTFGSKGNLNGEFTFPTSIAIDEAAGEIIVTDLQLINPPRYDVKGARVQVFNMSGGFKRSFGEYGQGEGKLTRPKGVAVDGSGRIYVSDGYQNVVQVFDSIGTYLGAIYDYDNPMRVPMGIALGNSSRLFVVSLFASRVDVFGIDAYTAMQVTPLSLTFEAEEGGIAPLAEEIQISSTGLAGLSWTAVSTESWITISTAAGITPAGSQSVTAIGVDLSGLQTGTYTGSVQVSAENGGTEIITVSLKVTEPPAELLVAPLTLQFTSVNGSTPSAEQITITNTGGGTLSWTAIADNTWIQIDKAAGEVPDTVNVTVETAGLSAGEYTGNITVEGAGQSATVSVTLSIEEITGTINVSTNLIDAAFTINGPGSYTGSGVSWTVSGAYTGTYTIIYADAAGYTKPASESLELQADSSITFTGNYKTETVEPKGETNIIVGAGPGSDNPATVKVLTPDGSVTVAEFTAGGYRYGVNVAAADIDGDGLDEIITGAGPGSQNPAEVRVYDITGNDTGISITAHSYKYGANVAGGDLDGDGRDEVITGAGPGSDNPAEVKVYRYNGTGLIDSGISLTAYAGGYGVRVAAGDIDGDGVDEIITAPGAGTGIIKIWKVGTEGAVLYKQITADYKYSQSVSIACGDINGDGVDEIITGAGPHEKAQDEIKVYDQDGGLVLEFSADISRGYGANVAAGDMDGDGVDEIITGAGPGKRNKARVKVFDASGVEQARFRAFNTKYGANAAAGYFGK